MKKKNVKVAYPIGRWPSGKISSCVMTKDKRLVIKPLKA